MHLVVALTLRSDRGAFCSCVDTDIKSGVRFVTKIKLGWVVIGVHG